MTVGSYTFKLEKRLSLRGWQATIISVSAIVVALFLFGFIFLFAGVQPGVAYREIFAYAFATPFGVPPTIARFIFLLLASYAFVVPYRAGLWNIGMPGQLYAGALAAYGVLFFLDIGKTSEVHLTAWLVWPMMLGAAVLAGAVVGGVAGFLKGKYNVNEIVVTMMLNFMLFWLVSFMIKDGGPFMNPGGRGESFEMPPSLRAPAFMNVPFTILIALGVGLLLHYIFARTRIGYEIRAYGQNIRAARYAGISVVYIPLLVFAVGGALAGLAGYHYFAAVPGVYKIARNYGFLGDLSFYGIICGLIAQGNTLAVVPIALLFAGLSVGGRFVQGKLGMGFGLDYALLGVLMITLVAFQFFYRYKIVWVKAQKLPA